MNKNIESLNLKGGYYYSAPTETEAGENKKSDDKTKPSVQFNLLIVYGEKPTVQILPESYTREHVHDRMEGAEYKYIRACFEDDTLYDLGNVR